MPKNFAQKGIKVEHAVTIDRLPEDLYRFWRNIENLPTFMTHLESVRTLNDGRSHWVVKAPAGKTVEWDAEIHNEIENELIAWRSLESADIHNAGSVRFRRLPNGQTEVKLGAWRRWRLSAMLHRSGPRRRTAGALESVDYAPALDEPGGRGYQFGDAPAGVERDRVVV